MNQNGVSKILMKSRPFRYLTQEELSFVLSFGEALSFKNNQIIISQGKVGAGLYIILTGKTKVQIRILGEESLVLARMGKGNFFGEPNLLYAAQSTATVIAASETICFFLSKTCFDSFSIGSPHIKYAINRALVEDVILRYRDLNLKLTKLLMKHPPTDKKFSMTYEKSFSASMTLFSHTPVFNNFTEKEKKLILKHSKIIEINRPTFIIKPKSKKASCFLILKGALLANITNEDRFSHFVVHPPHTLVCPLSLIESEHNGEIFSYYTGRTALLLEIDREFLDSLSKKNPMLWYKFYELFCEYIFSLQKNLNMKVARLTHEKFMDFNPS